ncbi:MAG: hypothetical protein F9K38_09795 [Pseudorhodoplanes sp.]|nr:MAG: hypothetical protein F9K38_09795 [Pseudorhodoplanes sp.]
MTSPKRVILLETALVAAVVAGLCSVSYAGPNSISPSMGGFSIARPDLSIRSMNTTRGVLPSGTRSDEAPAEARKKKKSTATKSEGVAVGGKTRRQLKIPPPLRQDTLTNRRRIVTPGIEGSPQPDPPKLTPSSLTGGTGALGAAAIVTDPAKNLQGLGQGALSPGAGGDQPNHWGDFTIDSVPVEEAKMPGAGSAGGTGAGGVNAPGIATPPATQPGASGAVAVPSDRVLVPPGLDQRLQDKANALAIREIEALLGNAGVGLPGRQPGRPGQAKSPLDAGLQVPEPNATVPGARERPSAEDILAGRGFNTPRDDKYNIESGYPGAAGGAVPDPRGEASDGGDTRSYTDSQGRRNTVRTEWDDSGHPTRITHRVHTGRRSWFEVEIRQNSGGIYYERRTERRSDGSMHTTSAARLDSPPDPSVFHPKSNDLISGGVLKNPIDRGDPNEPKGPAPENPLSQPAPTDENRTPPRGGGGCVWLPGGGCLGGPPPTPMEMTGQPGRGERSEVPVAGLPDSDQVTNPAEGREGPVGLRAPVNPGGNQPVDPDDDTNPPAPR